jgi:hypothetical protein
MDARTWVDLGGVAATIVAAALTQWWVGSINAAKFAGASEQRFKGIGERFDALDKDVERLEQVDRDQWKALSATNDDIGAVRDRVSKVEGRMNGKAHSAGM